MTTDELTALNGLLTRLKAVAFVMRTTLANLQEAANVGASVLAEADAMLARAERETDT